MLTARKMGIEVLRAALVLALLFLSFAHAPSGVAAGPHDVLTAAVSASFCGDAPSDDGKGHAPCHACRIGGAADIPAPPCSSVDAPIAVAPVTYFGATVHTATYAVHNAAQPRAPPALV